MLLVGEFSASLGMKRMTRLRCCAAFTMITCLAACDFNDPMSGVYSAAERSGLTVEVSSYESGTRVTIESGRLTDDVKNALSKLEDLRSLRLVDVRLDSGGIEWINNSDLQRLALHGSSARHASELAESLQLSTLQVSAEGLSDVDSITLPNLSESIRDLRLVGLHVSEDCAEKIQRAVNLQSLSFIDCVADDIASERVLTKPLDNVNLRGSELAIAAPIPHSVTHVNAGSRTLTREEFQHVVMYKRRMVSMEYAQLVDFDEPVSIWSAELVDFSGVRCSRLTLASILQSASGLEIVDLSGAPVDDGVRELFLANNQTVSVLDISNTQVSDEGIHSVLNRDQSNLRLLLVSQSGPELETLMAEGLEHGITVRHNKQNGVMWFDHPWR
jgi:hypothetical protein